MNLMLYLKKNSKTRELTKVCTSLCFLKQFIQKIVFKRCIIIPPANMAVKTIPQDQISAGSALYSRCFKTFR